MIKNNLLRNFVLFIVFGFTFKFSIELSHATPIQNEPRFISNSKQLTFEGSKSGEGYFSADGQKMIFQSERDPKNPFYQIFMMDLVTGKIDLVSKGYGKTTCGWIHPNLNKIMWSSTHLDKSLSDKVQKEFAERAKPVKGRYSWSFDEQFDIFESDITGKKLKQLTKELGYDAEGSYSPDGRSIVFASNRTAYDHKLSDEELKKFNQDPSYFMEIYIMNADGTNVRRLTNTNGYDGGPFFSADGKKITWRRFSESGASAEIYTMDVDGKNQKQITKLNSMSWAPFYHPSGDYIVFATTVGGYANFELFIVDSEGKSDPVRVTYAEGFDGLASFSPDGQQITWSHRNEKGESQIYLANWNDDLARQMLKLKPSENKIETLTSHDLKPEIIKSDIKKIVKYLASEQFKGRLTGSDEELIYSQKIADLFKSWGLDPGVGKDFIQKFEFVSDVTLGEKNEAQFQGRLDKKLQIGSDYQVVSYSNTGVFKSAPMVFAGYGLKAPAHGTFSGFDSYLNLNVNGKWVVILDDMPKPSKNEFSKHTYLLAFSGLQHKLTVAKNLGAIGVIVVSEGKVGELKFAGRLAESKLPVLRISSKIFDELILKQIETEPSEVGQDLKSTLLIVNKYNTYESIPGFNFTSQYFTAGIDLKIKKSMGHNVIAKINIKPSKPGLLIGAHGDHLGLGQTNSSLASGDMKNQIHYGADDNASGVSGVLELAHFYSQKNQKQKLQRSIYFAVWSGEEIGALGSSFYARNEKNITSRFLASLNMDMIGRLNEHLNVQGVGSATGFKSLAETATLKTGVSLNLTNDPYLPTDSMSFYLKGLPSVTFFTGAHREYHTPLDRPETLNYDGIVQVLSVVKDFTDSLAGNFQNILKYEKVEGNSGQKLEGRSFRIFLGTIPDYSQEGIKGVKISGVAKNSPAEKANLQSGDIIIEFDKTKIENIYDYVYTLQSVKPNLKTDILILRKGKQEKLDIIPVLKE